MAAGDNGRARLVDGPLLYCTGRRLMACIRPRIKDVDFARGVIVVRESKSGKDRRVPLPKTLQAPLRHKMDRVRMLHADDVAVGLDRVWLPHALDRNYPNAAAELGWQYPFPSRHPSPHSRPGELRRHHDAEAILQRAGRAPVAKVHARALPSRAGELEASFSYAGLCGGQ